MNQTGQRLAQHHGLRPVFIDALNVAHWRGQPPSLQVPLALMSELMTARHTPVRLYFDASARYRLGNEAGIYLQLMARPEHFIEVPSGRTADVRMLKDAMATGACVLSRDKFRDHRKRFRRLIDCPARLLPGFAVDGRVYVPALELDTALPDSLETLWQRIASALPAG